MTDRNATPVLDVLTYYVDLMCWFLEGNPPVEVVARGQMGGHPAAVLGGKGPLQPAGQKNHVRTGILHGVHETPPEPSLMHFFNLSRALRI